MQLMQTNNTLRLTTLDELPVVALSSVFSEKTVGANFRVVLGLGTDIDFQLKQQ